MVFNTKRTSWKNIQKEYSTPFWEKRRSWSKCLEQCRMKKNLLWKLYQCFLFFSLSQKQSVELFFYISNNTKLPYQNYRNCLSKYQYINKTNKNKKYHMKNSWNCEKKFNVFYLVITSCHWKTVVFIWLSNSYELQLISIDYNLIKSIK